MIARVRRLWRRRLVKIVKPFGPRLDPDTLRVSLCDLNEAMVDQWIDAFRDVDAVEIAHGNLLDLETDSLVSPANSFGDMSGGIDKAIDDFFGGAAQRAAVAAIRDRWLGELPVGAALSVPLPSRHHPTLIVAPTMRVPGNVSGTLNAYLAMRAVLVATTHLRSEGTQPLLSLGVPGLCTGVGGMGFGVAAQQMRAAYDSVAGGGWKAVVHPAMAPYALGGKGRKWNWAETDEGGG